MWKKKAAGIEFNPENVSAELKSRVGTNFTEGAAIAIAICCEYLCAEVIELAGNQAMNYKKSTISAENILTAINEDEELDLLLMKYPEDYWEKYNVLMEQYGNINSKYGDPIKRLLQTENNTIIIEKMMQQNPFEIENVEWPLAKRKLLYRRY